MNEEKIQLILGIPDKKSPNDLEAYQKNAYHEDLEKIQQYFGKIGQGQMGEGSQGIYDTQIQNRIQDMKNHPQQYFNFGFTYEDFKAYLMKLMYCRALRKFIERKRLTRIQQYFQSNDGIIPMTNLHFQDQMKIEDQLKLEDFAKRQIKMDPFKMQEQDQ